jgi:hypothetical protein
MAIILQLTKIFWMRKNKNKNLWNNKTLIKNNK